jgi:hypothetical protein
MTELITALITLTPVFLICAAVAKDARQIDYEVQNVPTWVEPA